MLLYGVHLMDFVKLNFKGCFWVATDSMISQGPFLYSGYWLEPLINM